MANVSLLGALGGLEGSGLSFRNKLINGAFDVWQRNTPISDPSSNGFLADRWQTSFNGTGATRTISRQNFALGQTEVPGNPKYFLKFLQSVAGSGGSFNQLFQRIEGVETLSGQTVTLSFYAKAAADGSTINARARQNFGTGGSPSADVVTIGGTATLTTGWQRFQFTLALPSISGKVLGTNNNDRLQIELLCPFNTTFEIDIADVQLEAGPAATPFERKTYGDELRACQRYYQIGGNGCSGIYAGPNDARFNVVFPVDMRVAPTVAAIAAPQATNPTVAETQTGSISSNFLQTATGGSKTTRGCSKIQFGGFTSGAEGRPCNLNNDCLSFSAEL